MHKSGPVRKQNNQESRPQKKHYLSPLFSLLAALKLPALA